MPAPAAAWVRGVVDGRDLVASGVQVLSAYVGPVAHEPALIAQLGAVDLPALVVRAPWTRRPRPTAGPGRACWPTDASSSCPASAICPLPLAPGTTFAAIDAFLSPPPLLFTL